MAGIDKAISTVATGGKKAVDIVKGFSKRTKPAVDTTAETQAALAAARMNIPTIGTLPEVAATTAKAGLRNTLFGSKKRALGTVAGGLLAFPPAAAITGAGAGLYSRYMDLFSGDGADATAAPMDYSQVYNPQTALEQSYAAMRQNLTNQLPSGQAEIDRLRQFSGMLGGTPGTGVSRNAGANVYDQQARAIREANVPSTATSGVVPLAGPLAAQADALVRQGATLNDYLGFMENAASAAGIKMDQATRNRLYTLATNSYYKKANEVQEALAKLDQQYLQGQMQLAGQPQFIVDQATIDAAEQRREAGGNQLPLEAYLSQAAREYYSQLNQKR